MKTNNCEMFFRPISVDTFPEHFQNMSCDENRGFSEEYEVGLANMKYKGSIFCNCCCKVTCKSHQVNFENLQCLLSMFLLDMFLTGLEFSGYRTVKCCGYSA